MIPHPHIQPFKRGQTVIWYNWVQEIDCPARVVHCKWLAGFKQWNVALQDHLKNFVFWLPADRIISQRDYLAGRVLRGGRQ